MFRMSLKILFIFWNLICYNITFINFELYHFNIFNSYIVAKHRQM